MPYCRTSGSLSLCPNIPIYTCIHTWIETCAHTCVYIYTYIHVSRQTHTYIRTYMHTYIDTYLHACMHAYIRSFIHSHIDSWIHSFIDSLIHSFIHSLHTYKQIYIHRHTYIEQAHNGQQLPQTQPSCEKSLILLSAVPFASESRSLTPPYPPEWSRLGCRLGAVLRRLKQWQVGRTSEQGIPQ